MSSYPGNCCIRNRPKDLLEERFKRIHILNSLLTGKGNYCMDNRIRVWLYDILMRS